MNVMEFQNYAKDSAKTYYKYLEENGKGLSEISVRTIRHAEPYFHLTLSKRLPAFAVGESLKSMKFRILGKLYSGSDMNPYEYDSQSAILTLDPQKERLRNLLLSVSVEDIFVISDLKFLVKRVFDWYTSHGEKIQLPLSGAFRANMAFSYYGALPTDEQKRAIHGALTSPFSYVWGAPGTGKTQCVLANCVLNVLLHKPDSQVLLIAPTNNAVEQMLFGILPILEGAGIPSSAVLRLGIASPKFAEKYKDSCETYYLQQKINSITTERGHLLKYIAFLEFESKLSAFRERLPGFLSDLNDARQKHSNLVGTLSSLESKEISLKTTWLLLENDIAQLQKSIHAKRIEIASFRGKLKKLFLPSSYETMQRHLDTCYDMLRFKDKSIADTQNKLSDLYSSIAECKDSFEIVEYTVSNIKSHMMDVSPAYAPLKHAIKTFSITSFAESADNLFRSIEAAGLLLDERRSRYAAYENVSVSDLTKRLQSLTKQLDILQEESQSICHCKKRIIAATIDRFISMFPMPAESDFSPQHIFMDEAAYCSLIKGATLLSLHVPVTFLGDHMQLPSVGEMEDRLFIHENNWPVFMWAQSAIYLDSIFHKSLYDVCDDYISGNAPDYTNMVKYTLTLTHRFGKSISSVLAGSVYDCTFRSINASGTSIVVLDAPHSSKKSSKKRVSISECDAITQYLEEYKPTDYAILTPYRNQVAALTSMLPNVAHENRILTVHASQGREFDTLIYSVVDTSDMYFVDSAKPIGKRVTNTAISRARKKLVIACDCRFWRGQSGQLIASLVNSADEVLYEISTTNPPA